MGFKKVKLCLLLGMDMIALVLVLTGQRISFHKEGTQKEMQETMQIKTIAASRNMIHGDNDSQKIIALSFDDGPNPLYTGTLLDGLKKRNVKASFFVTGENVAKYPSLIKRMSEEGHLIGNHTYYHTQFCSNNESCYIQEIIKTNEAIKKVTGEDTVFMRPPYGSWNKKIEEEVMMFPVFWTIDPKDWCTFDTDTVTKRVLKDSKEGEIILLHDAYPTSVEAAFRIVDALQKEGYEFVTVDEMVLE